MATERTVTVETWWYDYTVAASGVRYRDLPDFLRKWHATPLRVL